MTKKKRPHPSIDDVLARPWCYYCERDFDDLRVLNDHQKAKHFRCLRCNRRLHTAGGLSVHMNQVHKEQLTTIENALPNRVDPSIEIFGMEGMPQDILDAHRNRLTNEYFKQEAQRRAETGNPPPGGNNVAGESNKRPKLESKEDLKQRLAAFKAKKQAEKLGLVADAGDSQVTTPNTPSVNDGSGNGDSNSPMPMMSGPFGLPPQPPSQLPPHLTHPSFPPPQVYLPHGMPPVPTPAYSPPIQHFPPQTQHFPPTMHASFPPPIQGLPLPMTPVSAGLSHSPQPRNTPTAYPDLPNKPTLPTTAAHLPPRPAFHMPNPSKEDLAKMHAGQGPPSGNVGPAHATLPHVPAHRSEGNDVVQDHIDSLLQQDAAKTAAPPQHASLSSHAIPPVTAADNVSVLPTPTVDTIPGTEPSERFSMQQASQTAPERSAKNRRMTAAEMNMEGASTNPRPESAVNHSPALPIDPATPVPEQQVERKKKKKSKDNDNTKLVYADELVSPEEKRALRPKYAFKRTDPSEYTLGLPTAAVTGPVGGPDHVLDPQSSH